MPGSRLAWFVGEGELLVFSAGNSHEAPLELQPVLESLCAHQSQSVASIYAAHDNAESLLLWLLNEGTIELHEP